MRFFRSQANKVDESSSNSNPRTSAIYQPAPMRIIDAPKAFFVIFSSDETDDHIETNIAKGRECSEPINTIHPYFSHVTLGSAQWKSVCQSEKTPFRFAVKVVCREESLCLCHSNNLTNKETPISWKASSLAKKRGWSLREESDKIKLTHFGKDEEFLNIKMQSEYVDDYDTVVSAFESMKESSTASRLGSEIMYKVMIYLPVPDIHTMTLSCKAFNKVANSRDFLRDMVRNHCYILPTYYEVNQEEILKECSINELKECIFYFGKKLCISRNMNITWMDGSYWKTVEHCESCFNKYAHLNYVWWFDMSTSFGLRKGKYSVELRLRRNDNRGYPLSIIFTPATPENVFQEGLVNEFNTSNSAIPIKKWTYYSLGQVEVLSCHEYISMSIRNIDCSITKNDLDFDCIFFKPLVN